MPRCVAIGAQSPGIPREVRASTRVARLSLIRERIPANSTSHWARSPGSPRMVVTMSAPCDGGFE